MIKMLMRMIGGPVARRAAGLPTRFSTKPNMPPTCNATCSYDGWPGTPTASLAATITFMRFARRLIFANAFRSADTIGMSPTSIASAKGIRTPSSAMGRRS